MYLDASTKEFVKNVQAGRHFPNSGGNDDQADAVAHMVAVVAVLAGNTSAVLAALEPVIRVTQDTDNAVAFGSAAARVLEKLIVSNLTAVEALTETVADLRDGARVAPHAQKWRPRSQPRLAERTRRRSFFETVRRVTTRSP